MDDGMILVIDAGTGGGRAIAVGGDGKVKAQEYRAWSYFEPVGLELYGKEFDPAEFQGVLADCCKYVIAKVGAEAIKGVVTTGMRQGCVFLDEDGTPVYGGPNRDVRGILFTDEIEELVGMDRAYSITGRWPPWMFAPARLYWFRQERPDLAARVAKILMINDWLIHWLSGEAVGEPTNAAETMLFDLDARAWSEELLSALDIEPGLMPKVMPCGEIAGEVTDKAAKATGISVGTPVIIGMADTQAAFIAAGLMRPGDAGVVVGSTAPVMIVMDEKKLDPDKRLWIGCHPLPGRFVCESNAGDAGLSYRGYVEGHLGFMAGKGETAYSRVEELMEDAGPGSFGARAYLGPVIWDLMSMNPSARAGISFAYPVSEQTAGPGNVARAILENIAFAVRENLERAAALAGEPERMGVAGGMTRSPLFMRILADVLGRPLSVVTEPEATAVGCAMAGFSGLGRYHDLAEAIEDLSAGLETIEPDEDGQEEYNDLFEQWLEGYPAMMGMEED